MNVELYKDLIKDERGNYYVAVQKEGNELTLVNAMFERSYRICGNLIKSSKRNMRNTSTSSSAK
ncbi:hypothetical protein MHH52_14240 [Paenibacillus sp. FSL K6-0276]|uniref:hypothetical protein n=1 Tax=Paenibacillus sp. FSL K6-0276 TaxID=2921450 RepID=UPI0030ECC6EA